MKNLRFYKETIKKLKGRVAAGATALVMLSMTSCGTKIAKNNSIKNQGDNSQSITQVDVPTYVTDYSKTGIYTESDYSHFVDNAYAGVKDIRINISKDDFNTAVLMLNQEHLTNTKENDTQLILDNYFKNSEGINVYDDANQLFQLLAEIRNYNTEYYADNNIYSFTNVIIPELLPEEELKVILKLEEYTALVREYYKGTDKAPSKEEVETIFETVSAFGMGTGKIEGKTQVSLSNGAIFVTENLVQEISVMCQNVIPFEKREELDNKLNSANGLFNLENAWSDMAYHMSRMENVEFDKDLYAKVLTKRNNLVEEVKNFSVTDKQISSLFAIANMDYFMKDTKNVMIFKEMYGEEFDITEAYNDALSAMAQIEFHNYSSDVNNKEMFDISKLFIDNKEDSLSVKGIMSVIDSLNSNNHASIDKAAKFLLDYSKYSNLATVNAYDEETGEILYLDKNSLSKGGTQVVNWLTLYAMVTYRSVINNDLYVENTIPLVDGNNELSDIYSEMVVMYDEHCAIRNPEEYNYEAPKTKIYVNGK